MTGLDSVDQIVSSVVHTGEDVGITLGIGGPENDDLVQPVLGLEFAIETY